MLIVHLALAILTQSGYAGSPLPVIDAALAAANVQPTDVVLDIGCGDGRVCVLAAKKYKCHAIGIELDGNLTKISRATAERNGVADKVKIIHGNIFDENIFDLEAVTVVYLYHQVAFLKKLQPQLEKLKPGTRIIAMDYTPIRGLKPIKTLQIEQHKHDVYMWVILPKTK